MILTDSGKKKVLNFPNPDVFLSYIQDLQNKLGLTGSDHIPVKLETRGDLKTNMEMILQSLARVCQALVLALGIVGVRQVAKSMRSSVSSRCRH